MRTSRGFEDAESLDSFERELVELLGDEARRSLDGIVGRCVVGEVFAERYRVVAALGEGGMGCVFRAVCGATGEVVALKLLEPQHAGDPGRHERFALEARNALALEHPNIIATHAQGVTEDGVPFLVMECLDGHSLRELLRDGPLAWRRAVTIALQVLDALHAAHTHPRQIIHRDIKPSNIMVAADDAVKVFDFGVAKALEGTQADTHGQVGSPHTMAPEQWTGDAVGPWSDVYALGCTVYTMLVGEAPYTGVNIEAIARGHTHAAPPDPRATAAEPIPDALAGWVMRAMATAPEDRFTTAQDARVALVDAVEHASGRSGVAPRALSARSASGRAGDILDGRYMITRRLGAGGFATVYAGVQLNMERPVAIKVLEVSRWGEGEARAALERQFMREIKSAAAIHHPNAVRVYDFGTTPHREPYLVMELLQGHELAHELAQHGAMAPERAVRLVIQALDALAVAHREGIVHRDLKPSNLFLTAPGTPEEALCVVDFGLASTRDDLSARAEASRYLGTHHYLAPEFIRDRQISPAVDVYQMGLVLVELLTGERAVRTTSAAESALAHCEGDLNVPSAVLGSALGPVLRKALHTDPSARYPDAGALRAALCAVPLDGLAHTRSVEADASSSVGSLDPSALPSSARADGLGAWLGSGGALGVVAVAVAAIALCVGVVVGLCAAAPAPQVVNVYVHDAARVSSSADVAQTAFEVADGDGAGVVVWVAAPRRGDAKAPEPAPR